MIVNHLVVSLTAWYAYQSFTSMPEYNEMAIGLVALGTALPDIDHPNSTIGSKFKWLSWPIHLLFGHRNITHSMLAVAMLYCLTEYISFLFPLVFGYAMHLVGDWLTPAGVKIFWPYSKQYRSPVVIPTNSIWEYVLVWGTAGALLTWIVT